MSGARSSHSKRSSSPSSRDLGGRDAQRERLLTAFAECSAAKGLESTTVSDVVEAAGVSLDAFYEQFRDKEECFCAAIERMMSEVMDRIAAAQKIDKPWPTRLRNGVAAVLELFASRPAFTRLVMIEAPSSGRGPSKMYASAKRISQSLLERGREESPVADVVPASASAGAVAATESLVVGHVLAGRTADLPELVPDIVYIIMVQYRSQEEALRESQLASATS
jgi:AcrR family transcriptional regulator